MHQTEKNAFEIYTTITIEQKFFKPLSKMDKNVVNDVVKIVD